MESVKLRPEYNKVFELYVDTEEVTELDLVGLVAYGLYKQQKREIIIAIKDDNGGIAPPDEQIRTATLIHSTENQRTVLRERALELLTAYAEEFVSNYEPRIREEAITSDALVNAKGIRNDLRKANGIFRQIGVSLISAVIWTIILVLLVIATAMFGIDPIDGLKALLGKS